MQEFLRKKEISVIGGNAPKPVFYFEEAGYPEDIMATIRQQGFVEPTAIQAQVHTYVPVCVPPHPPCVHAYMCVCVCVCLFVCVCVPSY